MHQRVLVREMLWVMEDSDDFIFVVISSRGGGLGLGLCSTILRDDIVLFRSGGLLDGGSHFQEKMFFKK